MKRLLGTLLLLSVLLSLCVPALAVENAGAEETPTTHTVSTLDELQTALTNAEDNDRIVVAATIPIADTTITTDKDLTITRADNFPSPSEPLFTLSGNATLRGFSFLENNDYEGIVTIRVLNGAQMKIQNCSFSGGVGNRGNYIKRYSEDGAKLAVENCQFTGTAARSIDCSSQGETIITGCTITNCGGVSNAGTMTLSDTTITGNVQSNSGGAVFNSRVLEISNCEIYGNTTADTNFDADIYSFGTLSINGESNGTRAFYNVDTGAQIALPLTECSDEVKLRYLTNAEAAELFASPEETPPTPTTHAVRTLDELKTALTYAVDNDTIVISAGITIADEIISTDKSLTLTRSAEYGGDLLILGSNGGLSGFTIYDNAAFSSTVLVAVDTEDAAIENCTFSGDGAAFTYFVSAYSGVTITDTTFQDNGGVALAIPNNAATVSVNNCTFVDNTPPTGESAITNSGTLLLENTKIYENTGGIFNNGTLTVSNSEIYSNTEADLYNRGTLNIAESAEGSGYYKADTGEKLTMPLSDYSDTVNLLYLTDEEAAQRFALPEPTPTPTPEPTPEPEPTPTPTPTPEPEPEPTPEPDDDDNYTPPVYRPSRPVVTTTPDPDPEPDPAPAPALVCEDAVIDLSRSVVLHGYGDGQLHLEDSLTRAQMATILYRLLDEDTIAKYDTAESAFDDVPADMWCCTAVSTIAKAGIVNGVGNDRFNPNGKLTWAHIITVMTRFVEPQTYELQNIQYDGWAAETVQTAAALGWIEDRADLNPNAFITRGEFMDFVNSILAMYQTI